MAVELEVMPLSIGAEPGKQRIPVPTNEHGVVLPPTVEECVGGACNCEPNCHHLHSTERLYVRGGRKAEEFRKIAALTVWLPECRHRIYHDVHELDVALPNIEVMRQCVRENRKLKKLNGNRKELDRTGELLAKTDLPDADVKGLLNKRDGLLEDKEELMERVKTIEIIPEELITGALLVAAPECARQRMLDGSGFVLTGIMSKEEIPLALSLGNEFLLQAKNYDRNEEEPQQLAA